MELLKQIENLLQQDVLVEDKSHHSMEHAAFNGTICRFYCDVENVKLQTLSQIQKLCSKHKLECDVQVCHKSLKHKNPFVLTAIHGLIG